MSKLMNVKETCKSCNGYGVLIEIEEIQDKDNRVREIKYFKPCNSCKMTGKQNIEITKTRIGGI